MHSFFHETIGLAVCLGVEKLAKVGATKEPPGWLEAVA
jgi:hypothetical protein